MSDGRQLPEAALVHRIARLERAQERTERLLGRVIVTTMTASLTAQNLGHEIEIIIEKAGQDPGLRPLLTHLQAQMELLQKAVAEASDAE